jgi:hypothetical protein
MRCEKEMRFFGDSHYNASHLTPAAITLNQPSILQLSPGAGNPSPAVAETSQPFLCWRLKNVSTKFLL